MITEPQDRDDEDIAIYIDELKSDDPNLKLNAVSKIIDISKILGPGRTRDELIPYLTEIIEECDNEDEFLIKLAEQIVELKHYIVKGDDISLLLTPLEFISSIEEPKIRETAVKSIQDLVCDQSEEFFEKHVCLMVKRLIMWDNYTSKISGSALIPLCFKKTKEDEHASLRTLVVELGKDDTPMVRRATAQILNELTEVYSQEDFDNDLKDMLYRFLDDDIDSVRMKALEQLPFLVKRIPQEERDSTLLDYPLNMDPERKNWRVRYHIPDALVGICPYLCKLFFYFVYFFIFLRSKGSRFHMPSLHSSNMSKCTSKLQRVH